MDGIDLDDQFDVASLLLAANIPAESVGEILEELDWPEDEIECFLDDED